MATTPHAVPRVRRPPSALAGIASAGVAFALVGLGGCGESDIAELQARRLADARAGSGTTAPSSDAARPRAGDGSVLPLVDGEGGIVDEGDYRLVLDEEFTGLALDGTLWRTALPWGPDVTIDDELQYYVDASADPGFGHAPFVLADGLLAIEAIETPPSLLGAANGQPWLSGVLTTAERFEFTHGYVEARLELPEGRGLSPAFWMLGATPTGLDPRVFVMERDGARPDRLFHDYEYVGADGALRSSGRIEIDEAGLAEGFHTVALSWSPAELLFFLDGEPRYRVVGADLPTEDMYLILDLAISGVRSGPPLVPGAAAARWRIDYVRVWQRREGQGPTP